jgi:carboxyl-terminal processing protease
MRSRVLTIVAGLVLAIGLATPPAFTQNATAGTALFVEAYRILRNEALGRPTPETLLRGAEAGLQQVIRTDGAPFGLSSLQLSGEERPDLDAFVQRIESVQAHVRRPIFAVYGAIGGMVTALGDPNSAFYTPDAFASFIRRTRGDDFVGIGIVLETRDGQSVIADVLEDSPAAESGLHVGDVIVSVDGQSTVGLSLDRVSELIRGSAGSQVSVRVRRQGDNEITATMVRRRIQQRVVSSKMLPSGMGHLRLTQFTEGSSDLVARALQGLIEQGAKGIVLDMRGNPGGLLDASVNIASHFMERGTVVTLESRRGNVAHAVVPRTPKYSGPLVVVVDRGSASASEVVAGALQDGGVKVIGTRTYGKGTVQAVYTFPADQSGLRVTIARYLTPSGRDLEGRGLTPDFEIPTAGAPIGSADDQALNRAVALLQQASSTTTVQRVAP